MDYIPRYIEQNAMEDLERKMVFVAGPRQSGKTTLAKRLCEISGLNPKDRYMTWDSAEDRENIMLERFPSDPGILILDEIHKYSRWRQVVKGLYDKRGDELKIIVTGSARLDYYRRGGDSLQGRYHFYRLMPLTWGELKNAGIAESIEDLLKFGGFPEPFSLKSETQARRWSREYRTRVVAGDLTDLENVRDVGLVEHLVLRLPRLVGSAVSLNALREDLQVSHQSVSRWMEMLENLYLIFRIYPFGAPTIRAVKKEAKHYHWDWTVIESSGPRLENMVACHLLKYCYYRQDREGRDVELRYFRDVDKREVDFVLMENGKPVHFIECKNSAKKHSQSLAYLKAHFPQTPATQITIGKGVDLTSKNGIRVRSADDFLAELI